MRKREFRPTLDERLEERLVLTGHKAVLVTTNTYFRAVQGLDGAVTQFFSKLTLDETKDGPALFAFVQDLQTVSKTLPYGQKVLLPAFVQTFNNYAKIGFSPDMKGSLENVMKNYIENNSKTGIFKYVQSNVTHTTDTDITTTGHVPKGSKK